MFKTLGVSKKLVPNAAGLFMLIVGALLKVDYLFLMAAILFLMPLTSYWLGRALLLGLVCERELPVSCHKGERVLIRITMRNVSRLPKFYLHGSDRLPRWVRHAGHGLPLILQLWGGQSGQVTYYVEPLKSGAHPLGPLQIVSTDPLGFSSFTQTFPLTSSLLVYPTALTLRRSFLEGAAGQGGRGQDAGSMRGSGMDFQGIRAYQTGDELRRVHWRTTARTGKLVVSEYAQGYALQAIIALDLSRAAYVGTDPGPEGALETGITIAATLCSNLIRSGHQVQLLAAGLEEGMAVPTGEAAQITRCLDMLAHADGNAEQTLGETLQARLEWVKPGASLIYITSDTNQPDLISALADYRAIGSEIFGFVLDRHSYREGPRPKRDSEPGASFSGGQFGTVQTVSRGDDLIQTIEEIHDVRA